MGLDLIPVGVGDAFSELSYSTSLLLDGDESRLLIDCPHPLRKILREASLATGRDLRVETIDLVVLTHLHADHASGLEDLAYYCRFRLGRKVRLAAHPAVLARLWDGHLAAGMDRLGAPDGRPAEAMTCADYFDLVPLDEAGAVVHGPFSIACRPTVHPVPTTALRVTAGGRTLGYSADTSFDPTLIDWLSPADLIVHETNLGIHTAYDRLAALPEALRRRMRIVHCPDGFDPGAGGIERLSQGRVYSV